MFGLRGYRVPDIWSEMDRLNRQLDRAFGRAAQSIHSGVFPALNVYDDGESFVVRAEVPGVDPASLEINATGSALSISGERQRENAGERISWHRRERDFGRFSRSLDLPQPVDPDKVMAKASNGVLEIVLPKASEARPRRIAIGA